jgi:hypothetical protein
MGNPNAALKMIRVAIKQLIPIVRNVTTVTTWPETVAVPIVKWSVKPIQTALMTEILARMIFAIKTPTSAPIRTIRLLVRMAMHVPSMMYVQAVFARQGLLKIAAMELNAPPILVINKRVIVRIILFLVVNVQKTPIVTMTTSAPMTTVICRPSAVNTPTTRRPVMTGCSATEQILAVMANVVMQEIRVLAGKSATTCAMKRMTTVMCLKARAARMTAMCAPMISVMGKGLAFIPIIQPPVMIKTHARSTMSVQGVNVTVVRKIVAMELNARQILVINKRATV